MDQQLIDAVTAYMEMVKADYLNWTGDRGHPELTERFLNSVAYEEGRAYVKVVKDGSVHSFIVKSDSGKFKRGDILKAASYAAPAKNFARGNVFTVQKSQVRWTSAQ